MPETPVRLSEMLANATSFGHRYLEVFDADVFLDGEAGSKEAEVVFNGVETWMGWLAHLSLSLRRGEATVDVALTMEVRLGLMQAVDTYRVISKLQPYVWALQRDTPEKRKEAAQKEDYNREQAKKLNYLVHDGILKFLNLTLNVL